MMGEAAPVLREGKSTIDFTAAKSEKKPGAKTIRRPKGGFCPAGSAGTNGKKKKRPEKKDLVQKKRNRQFVSSSESGRRGEVAS